MHCVSHTKPNRNRCMRTIIGTRQHLTHWTALCTHDHNYNVNMRANIARKQYERLNKPMWRPPRSHIQRTRHIYLLIKFSIVWSSVCECVRILLKFVAMFFDAFANAVLVFANSWWCSCFDSIRFDLVRFIILKRAHTHVHAFASRQH